MWGEYTNTVWRWCYGSYDKCAPVESGNCHFTKATAQPTDGDTNLTITAKYQTRKGEFSRLRKRNPAAYLRFVSSITSSACGENSVIWREIHVKPKKCTS